jgi:hypothetical protein
MRQRACGPLSFAPPQSKHRRDTPNESALTCTQAIDNVVLRAPQHLQAAEAWHNVTRQWDIDGERARREGILEAISNRRAWVLMPFGHELSMLRLHVETLHAVVRDVQSRQRATRRELLNAACATRFCNTAPSDTDTSGRRLPHRREPRRHLMGAAQNSAPE